jgi:hypothetical protein
MAGYRSLLFSAGYAFGTHTFIRMNQVRAGKLCQHTLFLLLGFHFGSKK